MLDQRARGLIVSPPMTIDDGRLFVRSSQLDPQEVRFALLFWDKLVWPSSRTIYLGSGPDEQFLEGAGILTRPQYTVWGDVAQGMSQSYVEAFIDFDKREPGVWSLAQGENSLLIKRRIIGGDGGLVELYRAIPVPDKDVPLNEILEFKEKRNDELQLLRAEIDGFLAALNAADDKDAALAKRIAQIDAACANALKAGKEWRFPVRLSNLKASFELRPFNTIAAGLVGWQAGVLYGMPLASALLAGAGASFKISADLGTPSIRPRQGPYRYVYQFHREVF
jgi:hypothetical protein